MITVTSNIAEVIASINAKLMAIKNTDGMLRTIATNMAGEVKQRIHVKGIDAEGAAIGNYSEGYMKVRTGLFTTNSTYSKGKNKGKTKPIGVFTKGEKAGTPRPNYNRTNDTKVIISLTRQMENDWGVQATDNGYGLGYNNIENSKKVGYVESTYDKKIFALTASEKVMVEQMASEYVNQIING